MKLIIIAFVFWLGETAYFGWNLHPSCTAERICDWVAIGLCMVGYGIKGLRLKRDVRDGIKWANAFDEVSSFIINQFDFEITDEERPDRDLIRCLQEYKQHKEAEIQQLTVCLKVVSRGVATLWDSVATGMHDARSLVGDTTLSMQEALEEVGIDARGKESLKATGSKFGPPDNSTVRLPSGEMVPCDKNCKDCPDGPYCDHYKGTAWVESEKTS